MKSIFVLLAILFSFGVSAAEKTDWKALEQFFGMEYQGFGECVPEGYNCRSTLDCCSGTCRDGACYEIGGGCRGNGARCTSTLQCCTGTCRDGKCHEIGGCIPRGGDCENALDCCGSMSCWRDKCG